VPTVVLLVPTSTYRARDFVDAARALGADLVVATDEAPAIADPTGTRTIAVPLDDVDAAARELLALDDRRGVDAVVALDDRGVEVAAAAAERLGLPHNPPTAVAATRDKSRLRDALAAGEVAQPRYARLDDGNDRAAAIAAAARVGGYPVVVKPVGLTASQGVIRADGEEAVAAAARRAQAIAGGGPLLVEQYVPGAEVSAEGLLRAGRLEVLAVFDKPDPLEGPYFEETIFVTPSRLPASVQAELARVTQDACAALGLLEGPIHAELRVSDSRVVLLEVAARSIGGLCARALRFGAGISLEEVILRHALGMSLEGLAREPEASGVMMLPIPRAGTLVAVRGQDAARAVDGIVGLEITVPPGRVVQPPPEGDRYLGFLFARGRTPEIVEGALRRAHAALEIELA